MHTTVNEIHEYISSLPSNDNPEIFGMHENAHIAYLKSESLKILSHVLSVQPRLSAGGSEFTNDDIVLELVESITKEVPELIDTTSFHKDIIKVNSKGLLHCFSTVLMQEVTKYNQLVTQIFQTLKDLDAAVKGQILMSPALDRMYTSLLINQVPKVWAEISYPSLKPLGSWIKDLEKRVRFMRHWAKHGHPKSYWLSGFFFPHGFMTGILQTYARQHHKPIDLLNFKFEVMNMYKSEEVEKGPADGAYVYGLYMENASWNQQQYCIVDAPLGEMSC